MSILYPEVTGHAGNVPVMRDKRWEIAMAKAGILPLGGADLHRLYPKLWPSRGAGARALQDKPPPQLESLDSKHIIAGYRRKGVKGRSTRALIDLQRHPDPQAALTAALGPLAWYEVLEPVDKAPHVAVVEQRSVAEVTYSELKASILTASGAGTLKRNLAAFAEWRRFIDKNDEQDVVGPELEVEHDYQTILTEFVAHSRTELGQGAFANRMSGLKQIRSIYIQMTQRNHFEVEMVIKPPSSFGQALKTILKELDMTVGQANRAFKTKSISAWTRDAYKLCTQKGMIVAQEIERVANRPGYLTQFAEHLAQLTPVADFSDYIDPYREIHGRAMTHYRADLDVPELHHLRTALDQCIRFKTMPVPPSGMKRSNRWTLNKAGYYASARKLSTHVKAFFGWLLLPPSEDPKLSGPGLRPEEISFGLLGCQELTIRFLEFKAARVEVDEGHFWGGALITFEILSSLCRETGWLCQTENLWLDLLREQLPRLGIKGDHPIRQGYFERQHNAMLKWRRDADVDRNCFRLRNPWVTCKPFLDADSPMEQWIFPLIRNLVADRPSPGAPLLKRQTHERDLIMIVAFFAIPLRALNWRLCEVGKNIYKDNSGSWVIHVTREEFKNRGLLGKDFQFKIKLSGWCQPYFTDYIENVLSPIPRDLKGRKWLLPIISNTGNRKSGQHSLPGSHQGENAMMLSFANIFKRYFGYAIRPHAARHIVATDYLKADPRNLSIIAVILNDSVETVREEYASLITQDYATPFAMHMDDKAGRALQFQTSNTNKIVSFAPMRSLFR